MFSLSNTTLSSSPDPDGCRYWTSFDPRAFSKGERKKVFGGILNGKGPRRGELVVIKVFKNALGTKAMCQKELCNNRRARELAGVYNKCFHNRHIEFCSIMNALIDDVAVANGLLNANRKIYKSEWVLMEENVGKNFVTFINRQGVASKNCPPSLTAFVHWTYHVTSGQLVVCGLEGDDDMFTCRLKTPTIHSVSQQYGDCDAGEKGILSVFQNHKCNDLCRDLDKPTLLKNTSNLYPELPPLEPSAPYDNILIDFEQAHTQLPAADMLLSQFVSENQASHCA